MAQLTSSNEPHRKESETSDIRVSTSLLRWDAGVLETLVRADHTLPHGTPRIGEALEHTAERVMADVSPDPAQYMEQLYTFSRSSPDGRAIVVSYLAIFPPDAPSAPNAQWVPAQTVRLAGEMDHMVLQYSLVRLRAKLGYTSIASHLLPARFTLSDLQQAYEVILERPMDKRNFRRRMMSSGMVSDTGEKRRDGSHRPAALYQFVAQEDASTFLTPSIDQHEGDS